MKKHSRTTSPGTSIRDALAMMTEHHQGLLPVLDDDQHLVGVVADGDIRRGLLKGASLDDPIEAIFNTNPITASVELEQHEVDALMRATNKVCVPIVDGRGAYVRLAFLDRPLVPNCIPSIEGREQAYVAEAIAEGWLAVGPFIERFERSIADFVGCSHAVALSSGTAAIHLALLVAGVKPGDLVLVPTFTFAATANAVCYCGAEPVFFDSEPGSWGMCPDQVADYLETRCGPGPDGLVDLESGARIGAILPVHLYGHPVDMDRFISLSDRYNIPLIEDGAESLGASYKGKKVGTIHSLCCLSFNGNKVITGGNGGMVLTNDEAVARRIRYLSSQAKDDPVEFVHGAVGFNYRLPNINAAVALAQAETLGDRVSRKQHIVKYYESLLGDIAPARIWRQESWAESACWMALLTDIAPGNDDTTTRLRRFLYSNGIEARPVWSPLHEQTPFKKFMAMSTPVVDRLHKSSLCLPCSVGLTKSEIESISQTILDFFALYR